MSGDECRFIFTYAPSSAKAAIACKTHAAGASDDPCGSDYPAPALCTHAAAALQEKVRRLLQAGQDDLVAYNELQDEAAALRAKVEASELEAKVARRHWTDICNEVRTLAKEIGAKDCPCDGPVEDMRRVFQGLQARVKWLEEAHDTVTRSNAELIREIDRAEQAVGRLREATEGFLTHIFPKKTDNQYVEAFRAALSPQEPPNAS